MCCLESDSGSSYSGRVCASLRGWASFSLEEVNGSSACSCSYLPITSVGFLISGYFSGSLGLKPVGQLRGFGFYNLLSGMLFGAGIALCGGCILGTLRQIGEGNLTFVIVFAFFIPGMALVVYGLNPLLESGYNVQKPLLSELMGVPAGYVTAILATGAVVGLVALRRRTKSARRAVA